MKIFKCLSQNVSVVQEKEEKPERRKYLLDFRHKKRRLLDNNRIKESSSIGGGLNSAFKENDDLLLAGNIGSIVKTKYAAKDNSGKSVSPRSKNEEKLSPHAGGAFVASKGKMHLKTYKTLPTVQSTPVAVKCRSGNVESQGFSFDATANSNTSATTAFFRRMNISMSDYLPSFAIYESPKDRPDESNGKCSPDGNWLNVALLTSKSSDSCGYSSSNCSVPFAFYNSAVDWSSLANTSRGTESTVNSSTTTCNKGCSTSSDFDSSSSFASARSIPVTFIPNTKRKRLQFTTRSDTHLTTPAYRCDYYQKHTKVDTRASVEEHDPMEIACDSSRRIRDTDHDSVIATSACNGSVSQAGLGCDSISFTGIDFDYSSVADQDSKLFNKKHATKQAARTSICYDSVSQAGRDCDSVSSTGIDYDYSSTADQDSKFFNKTYNTSVCYESVSRGGDSVNFTGIDYDYSSVANQDSRFSNNEQVTALVLKATSVSRSVSRAGRGCDSISSTGIDYDSSSIADESRFFDKKRVAQQAPHTSVCYESVNYAGKGCDSINFTGIDYDYSITADQDSRILAKEQATQQMDTDSSQLSASITSECPASPVELKFMYIEQLMFLEHGFVKSMQLGIRKYLKPLHDSILTRFQHEAIFMNIDKIVKYSEANLKSMRENAAPDDSQTSEDQHMMLYLPAAVYDLEIQKQCQAYQYYGKELHMSNRLVADLSQKRSFRDFVNSQHARHEGCPSIQEFVNRPALHIQQLYTALHNILTVTPPDSYDAAMLVRVIDTIFKCLKTMKLTEHLE
ncbi:hypothetical protein BsWGS_08936 [Bradybaena similaris]